MYINLYILDDKSGNMMNFSDLSHVEMINNYWINRLTNRLSDENNLKIVNYITKRFNDYVLKYTTTNIKDIKILQERGYLRWNRDETRADIVYECNIIGCYESIIYKRRLKIRELI